MVHPEARTDRTEEGELESLPALASAGRVFCANCIHCKLMPAPADVEGQYRLRVRCDQGKWRKKLGDEKIYKYFTVARRSIAACDAYEDMGDADEFMKDLRELLPTADEVYSS